MEQPDRAGSSEDCSTSVSQKVQVQHVQQQQQHMQQMQPPEEHLLEEQRLEGMQQQHQQEAQIQRLQASRQDSIRVGEDFLDCEDASSSGSEGSGEAYSEEEEGCSTAGDGDELPLININSPAWVPDHTFKVRKGVSSWGEGGGGALQASLCREDLQPLQEVQVRHAILT